MGNTCGGEKEGMVNIRAMTLNWGGIPNGPFEYYISDYQPQLKVLGQKFEELCKKQLPGLNKGQKVFGLLEKSYKQGRYTPLFNNEAGIKQVDNLKVSMTKEQFENRWQEEFKKKKTDLRSKMGSQPNQKFEQYKQNLKKYDFLAYKAILQYIFPNNEWQQYLKGGKNMDKYIRVTEPFFEFSFLKEQNKIGHFRFGCRKNNPHIFFIQSYSNQLLHFLETNATKSFFWIVNKQKKLLTIYKRQIFRSEEQKIKKNSDTTRYYSDILPDANINVYSAKDKSYDKMMINESDRFVTINLQFSSSKKQYYDNQKNYLIELMKYVTQKKPKKTIIVGGDMNSFFNQFPENIHYYPTLAQEVTTFKQRTALQSQIKKKDKVVKESRDKIISNRKMVSFKIIKIDNKQPVYGQSAEKYSDKDKQQIGEGHKSKLKTLLPCESHPFDQLCVKVELEVPSQGLQIGKKWPRQEHS